MSNNTTWNDESARAALRRIFDAAVKSADPAAAVRRHLPEKPRGRCVVVGAGKGLPSWRLPWMPPGRTWMFRAWW